MEGDDGAQIHLREHVPVEHDDGLAERLAGVANGAGRPERRRLDDVFQAEARVSAVAEDFFDPARLIVQAEDDLVDFRDLLQQVELKLQERPVENRDDGFGCVNRKRTQSRALAPSEENRLHTSHR